MIRRGSAASVAGILAVGGALLLLGLRSGDPATADPVSAFDRGAVLTRAVSAAADATRDMQTLVRAAAEDARSGAARTVAGTDPPDLPLLAAAARLEAGSQLLLVAARAWAALSGTAAAVDPALVLPRWVIDATTLSGIAAQLRAAAPAAIAFIGYRQTTEDVLDALTAALAALQAGDPDGAAERLAQASAALGELAAWQAAPAALGVWSGTTGDLIAAVGAVAAAMTIGDDPGLAAARQRYAVAAGMARQADIALAVALSEGGAAITAGPLSRLGRLLGDLDGLRALMARLLGP